MSKHFMKLSLLTSPAFVVAVATLLLNDFVLKRVAPGVITGKLSDFAGLFAFATFFSALVPRRRLLVHVATAVAFVVWKSPLADPWIAAWNAVMPLTIARVIDATDLLALAVLPLSYAHAARKPHPRRGAIVLGVVALFAFGATSRAERGHYYQADFDFAGKREVLEWQMRQKKIPIDGQSTIDEMWLHIPMRNCSVQYELKLTAMADRTRITLVKASHDCEERDDDRVAMYATFRREVVEPLQLRAVPRAATP